MKRVITLILAVLMVLSMASCGKKKSEPATVPTTEAPAPTTETTIPAPTEPEWEPGISRAAYGEVLYTSFEKGAEVNVLGRFKDYYVVEGEEVDLLVEARFIRMDSEEAFETWTGYARWNTQVFDNVYLRGEPIAKLNTNKKVEVLDGKDNWLYIRWDDQEGYTEVSNIRKYPYSSGSSDGDGGGGSSGGSSGPVDGTGFNFNQLSSTVTGGWQVTLLGEYYGPEIEKPSAEEAFAPGMGKVIAEGAEGYITLALRGDEVKVTEKTEETITLWLADEFYGTIPRWIIRMEGDEEYESWTGYTRWGSIVYEEYQMRNEMEKTKTNTKVTVLDELPDCYVVELEDGRIGYTEMANISKWKFSTGGSGSSDDGGGSSGGGNSGGGGAVWTPPAM